MNCKCPIESPYNAMASLEKVPNMYSKIWQSTKFMGVARGKSWWGSFPKAVGRGCGAEPHVALQAKIFWVLDGGRIPRI